VVGIEKDIFPLVRAMNLRGFGTYASCQGHGYPCDRILPYIAFYAPTGKARQLEQLLRTDMESGIPQLRWGWWITAGFDGDYQLSWRLQPAGPHQWYSRYVRASLRNDIMQISRMIKLFF
jgi:hypothetical protein